MTGVLAGFEAVDIDKQGLRRMPTKCNSRALLEAFLASNEECLAKSMPSDELQKLAYNLRHYRRAHADEFASVGIAARNGSLLLYRIAE